jgi:hypothetical protein
MKNGLFIVLGILAILILTNPSYEEFKNSTGIDPELKLEAKRDYNFFVCSIYSYHYYFTGKINGDIDVKRATYFGILGNFFLIHKN